jgi:hypothetical protein
VAKALIILVSALLLSAPLCAQTGVVFDAAGQTFKVYDAAGDQIGTLTTSQAGDFADFNAIPDKGHTNSSWCFSVPTPGDDLYTQTGDGNQNETLKFYKDSDGVWHWVRNPGSADEYSGTLGL